VSSPKDESKPFLAPGTCWRSTCWSCLTPDLNSVPCYRRHRTCSARTNLSFSLLPPGRKSCVPSSEAWVRALFCTATRWNGWGGTFCWRAGKSGPPLPDLDAPLGTYRLAPNAFGSHNISAGWQSNVDLYQRGSASAVDGSTCASWPVYGEGHEVMRHAVSGVQEVGDLVLIPPRHWHQVLLSPVFCHQPISSCIQQMWQPPSLQRNKEEFIFSLGKAQPVECSTQLLAERTPGKQRQVHSEP